MTRKASTRSDPATEAIDSNGYPPSQPPLGPSGRTLKTANREESDNYHSIVVRLNAKWRVIICKGGLQWTLQRQRGKRNGLPIWRGSSFCVARDELLLCVREDCGPVSDLAMELVRSLPAHIKRVKR